MKRQKYTPPKIESFAYHTSDAITRASFAVGQDNTQGGTDIMFDQPIGESTHSADDFGGAGAKHHSYNLWDDGGSSYTSNSLWDD